MWTNSTAISIFKKIALAAKRKAGLLILEYRGPNSPAAEKQGSRNMFDIETSPSKLYFTSHILSHYKKIPVAFRNEMNKRFKKYCRKSKIFVFVTNSRE
jgi:hypothetical protein